MSTAAVTNRLYCDGTMKQFVSSLTDHYLQMDPAADKIDVQKKIKEWLTKGTTSAYIDALFVVDTKKNFPIWWAGFYVEDPDATKNPVENMKRAAAMVDGYSSLNVPLSNQFKNQSKFWKACSTNRSFSWGDHLSSEYTKMALRHNPEHIGLFLNKNSTTFVQSFFFKTELKLIHAHYKALGRPVQLHIFNLQENCDDIKQIIEQTLQSVNNQKKSYITIICKSCEPTKNNNGKPTTLTSCIQKRSTRNNKGGITINRNVGGRRTRRRY